MTAMHRLMTWPSISVLAKALVLLATVLSVLVGLSGILFYPLFVLAFSNLVLGLFAVALGVYLGSLARIQPWLALALGNAAVIVGAIASLVILQANSDTGVALVVFFAAAALILGGYSLLAAWLVRQVVRFIAWRI